MKKTVSFILLSALAVVVLCIIIVPRISQETLSPKEIANTSQVPSRTWASLPEPSPEESVRLPSSTRQEITESLPGSSIPSEKEGFSTPAERLSELNRLIREGDSGIATLSARVADSEASLYARRLAADALVGIGTHAALQALFEAVHSEPDSANRGYLARSLDSLADPESLEPVASLLETSTDSEIHSAVIDTLSRMAQPQTVAYLVEMHQQQVAVLGANTPASLALSALSNPEATGSLSAALASPETPQEILGSLARGLAKTSTRDSLMALAGHAAGTGPASEASLLELSALIDPSSLPFIKEIAQSGKNDIVRQTAAVALERIIGEKDRFR